MKKIRALTDKFAIGLSMLCTIHCLLLPLVLVVLPSLTVLPFADERFHLWMLILVIPTSLFALTLGCKQHKRYGLLVMGMIGLGFLMSAVLAESFVSPAGEKILTLIGTVFVALGHIWNYRLCQDSNAHNHCADDAHCHDA